jgi:serine/threonine-protein kinase HipA
LTGCPFCLGPSFHPVCAEQFLGSPTIPRVGVHPSGLETVIGSQIEKIGGVQPKFTADLSIDGTSLEPSRGEGGRFIIKPPWQLPRGSKRRMHLPQNEHLSMCLARLLGIDVASCALLPMEDGTLAYVTKRFDRTDDDPPQSLHQLDFCQLLDLSQEQKIRSSSYAM